VEKCALCGKSVCQHGSLRVIQLAGSKLAVTKCNFCGAGGVGEEPAIFCLPTHEGKVNFSSDVYSTVCPGCHELYNKNTEMIPKYLKNKRCGYCDQTRRLLFLTQIVPGMAGSIISDYLCCECRMGWRDDGWASLYIKKATSFLLKAGG